MRTTFFRTTFVFLCLCYFLVIQQKAEAQLYDKNNVFGLKAGPNLHYFLFSEDQDNTNPGLGFNAGLFFYHRFESISDNFSMQPHLLFSLWRSNENVNTSTYELKQNFTLGTVQLPVLFQYNVNVLDVTNMYIGMGPYLSYTFLSKIRRQLTAYQQSVDETKNIENFSALDFGGAVGVGVGIPLKNGDHTLSIELFGNLGFINVMKFQDVYSYRTYKASNYSVALMFGYSF